MPMTWAAFAPEISPHVPGCPSFTVELETRRAAQELFEESYAWKETLPDIAVTALAYSVALVTGDSGKEIARVDTAWFDGARLAVKTVHEMDASSVADWRESTGVPYIIVQTSPDSATLYPRPLANGVLRIFASLTPTEAATGLPDDMGRQFRDTIIAGARSKLMLYPEKAWTNPALGTVEQQRFESGKGAAQYAGASGFGTGRIVGRKKWC